MIPSEIPLLEWMDNELELTRKVNLNMMQIVVNEEKIGMPRLIMMHISEESHYGFYLVFLDMA